MARIDESITKLVEPKEDFLQMMQPFDNMASQLGCAPLSIAVLGQLCLVATEKDFDLRVEDGENKFIHLKHPESFRASLCQVSQAGYDAFMKADSCMEKIKLRSAQIPGHLKTALKILYGKDSEPEDIQTFLPTKLGAIKCIADECERDAANVTKYFQDVINVLSELECKTLVKQGKTQEAKEKYEFNIKLEEAEKKRLTLLNQQNEEDLESMKTEAADAMDMWKKSMNDMPGAGQLIGAAFTQGICDVVSGFTGFISQRIFKSNSHVSSAHQQAETAMDSENNNDVLNEKLESALENCFDKKKTVTNVNAVNALAFVTQVEQLASYLAPASGYFTDQALFNLNTIEYGDNETELLSAPKLIEVLKNYCLKKVKAKPNKGSLKDNLLTLITNATNLITRINKRKGDNTFAGKLSSELEELITNINRLLEVMKEISGLPHFHRAGPGTKSTSDIVARNSDNSLPGRMLESAQRKVEMSRANVESSKKTLEETRKRQIQSQRELQESMRQLQEFQHLKATSVEILKVIQKGLQAFATLREQWTQLVLFFQSIANLINCSLSPQLNNFVTDANKMSKMDKITKLSKEVVYQSAFQSVKVGHVVNHLAGCYSTISKEHLMPLVLQLFQLIILDKDTNKGEIEGKKMSLEQEANDAHEAIIGIINRRHNEYMMSLDHKMQVIDQEMKVIAPGISEERKKAIRMEAKKDQEKIVRADEQDDEIDLGEFC